MLVLLFMGRIFLTIRQTSLHLAVFLMSLLTAIVALPAAAQAARTPGGVMNIILTPEPPNLNLALQITSSTKMVAGKIYESLIVYNLKSEPTPGLARAWAMSADRLTYTFFLQKGVKWHDGTIEATDVDGWIRRVGAGDYQMAGNGGYQCGDPAISIARTYVSSNIRKGV